MNTKEITYQDLIDKPTKKPHFLEQQLSYFFGETKMNINNDRCDIELLDVRLPNNNYLRTYFSLTEIYDMPLTNLFQYFWDFVYLAERHKYASKKSG